VSHQRDTVEMVRFNKANWAAAGFKDTELGVNMEPEVGYGTSKVYARVQA
jgi:hypothetical protein